MAKFKCKQSGNIFEFLNDHDIKTMRAHTAYEEVVKQVTQESLKPKAAKKTTNENSSNQQG